MIRRLKNVQKSVMQVQSCCFAILNLLLFYRSRCSLRASSPIWASEASPKVVAVAVVVAKLAIVVIQIFCHHGNMTSHFSSLFVWYFLNQSIQLSIGVFCTWTNLKKHYVMASASQNWSWPETAKSLWRT